MQGETADERHKGCIDVLAWSWGVSLPVDPVGGGPGAPNLQDLSFTKYIDKASPILMQGTTKGTPFPKIELYSHGSCCETEYLKLTLENVFVTSFQTGGSAGEDRPTESVSLNFSKIEYCYTYFDEAQEPGVADCYGWDAQSNEPY
jgi:type VI secretion system secreted protein Hcp